MNYLGAQVNFRQLRAETAGNRYLWRFLPASAGIITCGSVYLRPSQVILDAPVLQWSLTHTPFLLNLHPSFQKSQFLRYRFFYKKMWYNFAKHELSPNDPAIGLLTTQKSTFFTAIRIFIKLDCVITLKKTCVVSSIPSPSAAWANSGSL